MKNDPENANCCLHNLSPAQSQADSPAEHGMKLRFSPKTAIFKQKQQFLFENDNF